MLGFRQHLCMDIADLLDCNLLRQQVYPGKYEEVPGRQAERLEARCRN